MESFIAEFLMKVFSLRATANNDLKVFGGSQLFNRARRPLSHSQQPFIKGARLVRCEVNTVMITIPWTQYYC